jgi:hypothetical protein
MSELNTVETPVETTPPEAKPAKARKPKAAEAKAIKPAKKVAAKAKPSANGAASRVKMIKPWRQVLTILSKGGKLTRQKIAAKVESQLKDNLIGGRVAQESKTYAALLERKYIRVMELDVDGKSETVNEITALGTKALAAAKAK